MLFFWMFTFVVSQLILEEVDLCSIYMVTLFLIRGSRLSEYSISILLSWNRLEYLLIGWPMWDVRMPLLILNKYGNTYDWCFLVFEDFLGLSYTFIEICFTDFEYFRHNNPLYSNINIILNLHYIYITKIHSIMPIIIITLKYCHYNVIMVCLVLW